MPIPTKDPPYLSSEAALDAFLTAWEQCTLPKVQWTHAAHVTAAACYTWQRTPLEALPLLRHRIRTFNEATGGVNTADAGYHETLTRFWAEVVGAFIATRREGTRLNAVREAVDRFGTARDLVKTHYAHDVVRDPVARREWVRPNPEWSAASPAPAIASPDTPQKR